MRVRAGHERVRQVGLQVAEVERFRLGHLVWAKVGLRIRGEVRVRDGVRVRVGVRVGVRVWVRVRVNRVGESGLRMGLGIP